MAINDCQTNSSDEDDTNGLIVLNEDEKVQHDLSEFQGGPSHNQLEKPLEVPPIFKFSAMSIGEVSKYYIEDVGIELHRRLDDKI